MTTAKADMSRFHLDKKRIAKAFAASILTYEKNAGVQRRMADHLLSLFDFRKEWKRGLDIGCGTGYLSERILKNGPAREAFFLNDLAPELCDYALRRLGGLNLPLQQLPGDIETISVPASLDLICSSSSLQWIEDLDRLLERLAEALAPEGVLAFSLFGAGTMKEITSLLGRRLHYHTAEGLFSLVSQRFRIEVCETREETVFFSSLFALFRHIRNTGVRGLGQEHWTRDSMKRFESEYRRCFGHEKGLPVSYTAHFIVARAHDGSLHR